MTDSLQDVVAAYVCGMTPGMNRVNLQLDGPIPEWADLGCHVRLSALAAPVECAKVVAQAGRRWSINYCGRAHEDESGDWVQYEDHATEIGRLDVEVEALRAELQSAKWESERNWALAAGYQREMEAAEKRLADALSIPCADHDSLELLKQWRNELGDDPNTFSLERAALDVALAALSPGRSGEVAPKLREMDDLDEQDDRDLEDWLGDRS